MKKIVPINQEAPFDANEMFFSATDGRGVIEFGNEVFIRISAYSREAILGKAHNIIRHPDMPRCVFKVFWDTLKSGSPVAAFVKNMSSQGHYYWVFAFAFPVESGYLSIRFKPSSELFKTVQSLYADVLQHEKENDMEKAEIFLLNKLKELGFENYRQFMIHAAVTELKSLDRHLITETSVGHEDPLFSKISRIKLETVMGLNKSFSKINDFSASSNVFNERMILLDAEFKKLKMLAINMSVLANKFGSNAASLAVISEYFSTTATQIENQLKTFSSFTHNLLTLIEQSTLEFCALKTQMNMVDFFVKESLSKMQFDDMLNTKDMFISLFSHSTENLVKELNRLSSETISMGTQIMEIQKFINGLEIIKQTGAIESSRDESIKAAFGISLKEMAAFTLILRQSIDELSKARSSLQNNAVEMRESFKALQDNVEQIFKIATETHKRHVA